VGLWRRFVPELRTLRARIQAGELGDIYQISCMQWDEALPSEEFRATSGGIAIDMGIHEFDQIRWLTGQEIEWVCAAGYRSSVPPRPATDPDAATILAGLSGGGAAVVSLGRRFPFADSMWLELWGTDGYERVPFMWDPVLREDGEDPFMRTVTAQVRSFAGAVRGGPREGAGGADAAAGLRAASLAVTSLRNGGAVSR
jgi:myo-inositol 2-dehydrogenase/D-chiro-inositol 1-dehydrogenase